MNPLLSSVVSLYRMLPWSRNPLMRATDRLYFTAVIVAVVVFAASVPICAAVGTAAYSSRSAELAADRATKHEVEATVVGVAPAISPEDVRTGAAGVTSTNAEVSWTVDGQTFRSSKRVPGAVAKGDHVSIWLDSAGERVDAPLPTSDAAAFAISCAMLGIALSAFALLAGLQLLHAYLAVRNRRAWTQEWELFDRNPRKFQE
ncbi:hypothetical protein JGU71_20745 [Antrihabitans sp. YC3-6]|uniref:Uncharacterized protein n=1 Tax=Antrihabitans stalagmiti TaxID=2799499 RepID=A0A934NU92_9NOCA|nr:hypothetical protein [Antrihabitans stalagmiti]MBJ8341317.1 hypothetical protein [Antrihabitans stalagmiti]